MEQDPAAEPSETPVLPGAPRSLPPSIPPSTSPQAGTHPHPPPLHPLPPPNLLAALQPQSPGGASYPLRCQHRPPRPLPHPQISPNWVRGLSADSRRASRCVWARRSPGKVRQAPRKEHRATSPSLKASLARGSLRREKAARGARGHGSAPSAPQTSKKPPPNPVSLPAQPPTHVHSQPRRFRMLSRLLLTLASPAGSDPHQRGAPQPPGTTRPSPSPPHPPGSRPNSR